MQLLAKHEKKQLLALARQVLVRWISEKRPGWEKNQYPIFEQKAGIFVSLYRHGQLRGCLGQVEAVHNLAEGVQRLAVAAATRDFRFTAVGSQELEDLSIEISILSSMEIIQDPSQIQVGQHGLMVSAEGCRGLLLPQVASKYEWDGETFLSQSCEKAGLPADYWRSCPLKIEVFSAQVFSELESRDVG